MRFLVIPGMSLLPAPLPAALGAARPQPGSALPGRWAASVLEGN
jgi:hypothetical protein